MIARWTAATVVLMATTLNPAAAGAGLDDYVWKNRLVLSFVSTLADSQARRQRDQRRYAPDEWRDRDLLLIEIGPGERVTVNGQTEPGLQSDHLRRRFTVDTGAYAAILVGKDGGEKMRKTAAIRNGELFGVIDAMPMRRQEMQRKTGG